METATENEKYLEAVTELQKKLIMLGSDNPTTWIVYNHLVREFGLFPVFIENPASRVQLIKNRIRKLGLISVIDQLAFILLIRPFLQRRGHNRIKTICQEKGLETVEPLSPAVQKIESVNSESFRKRLIELNPDIILVNEIGRAHV